MNLGQKALQVLRSVAPTLGTAIGGPFGTIAGIALSKVLGTDPSKPDLAEPALLNATPDQLLALKKAEEAFALQMEQLGVAKEKLVYDDIASARAREATVKDHTPAVLAYFVTAGFVGTLAFMLVAGKPAIGGDALLVMLGSLGTSFACVISYYFGSSSGSADKTRLLVEAGRK